VQYYKLIYIVVNSYFSLFVKLVVK